MTANCEHSLWVSLCRISAAETDCTQQCSECDCECGHSWGVSDECPRVLYFQLTTATSFTTQLGVKWQKFAPFCPIIQLYLAMYSDGQYQANILVEYLSLPSLVLVYTRWNILLQRWTCSVTSSPTPPPPSMWSSYTKGSSDKDMYYHSKVSDI